jgi:hypothetical protein
LLPLIFTVIGLYIFLYYRNLKNDYGRFLFVMRSRRRGMIYGLTMGLFTGLMGLIVFVSQIKLYHKTKDIYNGKQYKIIKGQVSNYHPMPKGGGEEERFDVNNVHFGYMDNGLTDYGYNNAASNGGAIKPNLFVRIGYYYNGEKNIILKLETE